MSIAQAFDLFVPSENLIYPSIAKWRSGLMTGIAFAGEPYHSALGITKQA